MHFDTISVVGIIATIILTVLTALQKRGQEAAAKANVPAVVLASLDTLATLTRAMVGNAAQTVVSALRDPSKPGTWDAKAKAAVRESVTADVKRLGATALATLRAHGYTSEALDELLAAMRESAVNALGPQSTPLSADAFAQKVAEGVADGLDVGKITVTALGSAR